MYDIVEDTMDHKIICMGLNRTKDDYIRLYLTLQMYIKLFSHLFEHVPHWPIDYARL